MSKMVCKFAVDTAETGTSQIWGTFPEPHHPPDTLGSNKQLRRGETEQRSEQEDALTRGNESTLAGEESNGAVEKAHEG